MSVAIIAASAVSALLYAFGVATSATLIRYGRINDRMCFPEERLYLASRTYGATAVSLSSATLLTLIVTVLAALGKPKFAALVKTKGFMAWNFILKGLQIAVAAIFLWLTILTFRDSKWAISQGTADAETVAREFVEAAKENPAFPISGLTDEAAALAYYNALGPDAADQNAETFNTVLCPDFRPIAKTVIVVWSVGGFLALLGCIAGPIIAICAVKSSARAAEKLIAETMAKKAAAESAAAPKAEETKPAASSEEPAKESA